MTTSIDYYYAHISPYALLGHELFIEIARKHGASINFKPVSLPALFAETGGLPLGKRHKVRQEYRFFELQRWREKRNIKLNFKPAYFPVDSTPCDLVGTAIAMESGPAGDFALKALKSCWEFELDVSDPDVIAGIVESLELDPKKVPVWTESDEVKQQYQKNLEDAIDAMALGSPCYVLNGEPFWGQDRLDLLDDALSSGREPYRTL